MSKLKNFPCREEKKPTYTPNFRITQDNPLKILELHSKTTGNIARTLDQEKQGSLHRMVGSNPTARSFQVIQGVNTQVLTERFRENFQKVFRNRRNSILKGSSGNKDRLKHGSLEIYWPSRDIVLTKHHIIPRSRGGVNDDANYFWIPRNVHDDFHEVFDVLTPVEQLAFIVISFKPAYHPAFIGEMVDLLLSKNQNQHYKGGLLRHNSIEH